MPNVFVSYGRESSAAAKALAADIRALGHDVWFDQELTGGQAWWNQILDTVRNCDVFIFVLTPHSLRSVACMGEYGYAAALKRPILPILVADGVSTNLLPPALSQIQFVDYRNQDRGSALGLARALASIPRPGPLPDPLPEPPEVPISYLGGITAQIETRATLSYEQQSALVVDLKRGLRDPETTDDSRALLARLRKRRDLLATIADEVDELLNGSKQKPGAGVVAIETDLPAQPPLVPQQLGTEAAPIDRESLNADPSAVASVDSTPAARDRAKAALWGALIAIPIGIQSVTAAHNASWGWLLVPVSGAAIAGAIGGKRFRILVPAMVCAAIGWGVVEFMLDQSKAEAGVFGVPAGAILGALAASLFARLKSGQRVSSGVARL